MAHKTLTISEDAYNVLSKLKSDDESFTKAIMRLAKAGSVRPLSSFAGKWHGSMEETKAIFDELDRMWAGYEKELKKKLGHMSGSTKFGKAKDRHEKARTRSFTPTSE